MNADSLAMRQSMGLAQATSISVTVGSLSAISVSPGYLRTLVEILNRFPGHTHLFSGAGDIRSMRGFFHAQGVLPRIRFMGAMPDAAPLFLASDIYLAAFPDTESGPVLAATRAGKPCVVLATEAAAGAEAIGSPEHTARTEAEYLEIASRLLRKFREIPGRAPNF